MKVPEGLKLPDAARNRPRAMSSIKLRRSLYGLKQSGQMWYNRLSKYLLKEGFTNDPICPCVFIKKSESGFAIVAVYVDDMNLIGTPEDLQKTADYLKSEFEMKDLGKTKYCLGLQIEHSADGTLVHQSNYTEKVLKRIVGYADAGYLSDPHQGRSQTGYVFTCGGTAISWRSTKQTLVATSSNHSEILALHEASRECVWLRSMIRHIRSTCALPSATNTPTILNEDNAACIAQIAGGYIKGDRTKHISPKFFYTHELQKSQEIKVRQIRSSDNLADLFTKSLPKCTFQKLVHDIGLRQLCKQSYRSMQNQGEHSRVL
ncbi:unnamed protein product [Prunus brigantina]